jgi:hypothetical protein
MLKRTELRAATHTRARRVVQCGVVGNLVNSAAQLTGELSSLIHRYAAYCMHDHKLKFNLPQPANRSHSGHTALVCTPPP